ncbi:MAG: hypothetical protein RR263_04030, partial [Oscillospiraceae bacterium]
MKKIATKISLVLICCSCLTVLIITGISIFKGTQLIQRDTQEKIQWMAKEYSTSLSSEFEEVEDDVKEMENHVRATIDVYRLKDEPDYLPQYEKELEEYMYNFAMKNTDGKSAWCYFNPELSDSPHDVFYIDENNDKQPERQPYIPFSYFDNTPTPTDDKQWWYGAIKSKDGYWTNPYKWTLSNGQIIRPCSYARAIYINGELIAVVGTYYSFDDIVKQLERVKIYQNGYLAIYNDEMGVVSNPNYYAGTRFTSDNLEKVNDGKYKKIAYEMQHNNDGIINEKIAGDNILIAYSKMSNGWIMTVNPKYNEIFSDMNIMVAELLVGGIACIVFTVAIAVWLGKRFAAPILT